MHLQNTERRTLARGTGAWQVQPAFRARYSVRHARQL